MSFRIGDSGESSQFSDFDQESVSKQSSGSTAATSVDSDLWGEKAGLWGSSEQYESPKTTTERGVTFEFVNPLGDSRSSSPEATSQAPSEQSSESRAAFAQRAQQAAIEKGRVSLPSSQRPGNSAGPNRAQNVDDIGDIVDSYMRDDEHSQIPQATSRPTLGASAANRLNFAQRAALVNGNKVSLPSSPRPQKPIGSENPIKLGLPAGPRDAKPRALRSNTTRDKQIQDENQPIQTRSKGQMRNPLRTNVDRLRAGWLPASVHSGLTEKEQDQAAIEHEQWMKNLPGTSPRRQD
jgi:hypothetical protein